MEKKYENMSKLFKALSDPNRLIILEMLKSGENCSCKILEELHIGQSTLSHHMKILYDSGIIKCRKDGKWSYYSFDEEGCKNLKTILDEILDCESIIKKGEDNPCQ
ncbi:ArsR/SmtB family transcription factor [Fusobacterium ulcerans]|jgi:ArsR family transcriptional regulator|uniref:ArsR/SmtB family transcription factor n=1 Tax=Fusobacterium ulcerans TaxID=861 RepID=UPI001D0B929D|nr:metalloregulator ArsR/SmtB family transcription factor [Fusobacterium ulcerans]MCB8564526.1 metalloregulator ArsR/SmtB family transcription factor [Fusobacterium ulcerans]MCB8648697.1 metalloregulator ArsR/SmtB family transcription factor [Fusobacterium ulcerans]